MDASSATEFIIETMSTPSHRRMLVWKSMNPTPLNHPLIQKCAHEFLLEYSLNHESKLQSTIGSSHLEYFSILHEYNPRRVQGERFVVNNEFGCTISHDLTLQAPHVWLEMHHLKLKDKELYQGSRFQFWF